MEVEQLLKSDHQFISFLQKGQRYFRDRFGFSENLAKFFSQAFTKDFSSRFSLDSLRQNFNALTIDDLISRVVQPPSHSKILNHNHHHEFSPPRSFEKATLISKSPALATTGHSFAASSWADEMDDDFDYDEPLAFEEEEEENSSEESNFSRDDDIDIQFNLELGDDVGVGQKNKKVNSLQSLPHVQAVK